MTWWRVVTGSRPPGGRRGPAGHQDGQPAAAGHAGAQLRAHHEEIFQFRYAGRTTSIHLEAITLEFDINIIFALSVTDLFYRRRYYDTHA